MSTTTIRPSSADCCLRHQTSCTSTASMASVSEAQSKSAFSQNTNGYPNAPTTQSLPILSSSSTAMDPTDDSMDVSQPHTPSMAPPTQSDANANGSRLSDGQSDPGESIRDGSGGQQPVGAAAAAQQPKVVQTAFIHKLYRLVDRKCGIAPEVADRMSQHA